ncbi:MAG: hypothetical protein LBL07_06330 [Tannerella sp.]|jgi:antitoxin (DNA-binding transcriptional repressor) of toxin-antitoxin stability system|nr:hypothetical protein [Tannerella sp.]
MLVVSSRELREKQKSYLDKVDEGLEILIRRGKNKSYKIVPIPDNDTVTDKDYILKPDADLARAITAEQLLAGVKEDLREMFKKGRK